MRHGALIVRGGSVVSMGINRDRNHPHCFGDISLAGLYASTHAEMAALHVAKAVNGATIYIARINKAGLPRLSRPCDRCFISLLQAGIKEMVYTTN
jgi:deoxycytidylate deaminase